MLAIYFTSKKKIPTFKEYKEYTDTPIRVPVLWKMFRGWDGVVQYVKMVRPDLETKLKPAVKAKPAASPKPAAKKEK